MADYLVEKHFLTILKIFGLGPYTQDERGLYKVSKQLVIYFIIVLIYYFILQSCIFYKIPFKVQNFDMIFLLIFRFIDYFGFSLSCFFSAIIVFRKIHEFCLILNKIIRLNQELKNFDNALVINRSFYCAIQFGLFLLVNFFRFLSNIIDRSDSTRFLIIIISFSTYSHILLIDLFFTFLILNIRSLFRNINIITEKILKSKDVKNDKFVSPDNVLVNQIRFLKNFHMKINFAVNKINEEYSSINLMSVAFSSVILIYTPFRPRNWNDYKQALYSILYTSFYLIKIL